MVAGLSDQHQWDPRRIFRSYVALLEEPEEDFQLSRAVLLTQCAQRDTVTGEESLITKWRMWAYCASHRCAPFIDIMLILYMAMYLFEVPAWCWLEEQSCGEPEVVPRSPMSSTLPLTLSRPIQIVALTCFIVHTVSEQYALNVWSIRRSFSVSMDVCALVDTFVAVFNQYGLPPRDIYWSPLLRPFVYLGHSKAVQTFIGDALPAMTSRAIVDLVAMQFVLLVVWAWLGLLLFGRSAEGDAHFNDFPGALLSLFTMFTTANFPDVMMIAYSKDRCVFAYFFFYLLVSLYGLFNVLLAALFSAYKERVQQSHQQMQAQADETLRIAFNILEQWDSQGPGDAMTQKAWEAFCIAYRRRQTAKAKWDAESMKVLFSALVSPREPNLTLERWQLIAPELATPETLGLQAQSPIVNERALRVLGALHWVVDVAVVVSLLATVAQTQDFLVSDRPVYQCPRPLQVLHFSVNLLYVAEIVLRLVVLGVRQCQSYRWTVDVFLCSLCTILETALSLLGPGHKVWSKFHTGEQRLGRVLALFRVARVERVLWRFSRARETLKMLLALVSTFRTVGAALFLVFYLYSTVGVQVFGGRIRLDVSSLKHVDFAKAGGVGYWANNFNDFASGVVTLFELMVVNNWFVIAEGLALAAPGSSRVGWVFCISFYCCIHIVILNVLVTSVVESYERLRTSVEEPQAAIQKLSASLQTQDAEKNLPLLKLINLEPDAFLTEPVRSLDIDRQPTLSNLNERILLLDQFDEANRRTQKLQRLMTRQFSEHSG
mmetsp:Transcript_6666/g.15845  ORF Transcript_6666/g.15845 Transcript_6666/m.15845 type:complete len:773 (-) Transcript_6666:49-2367(-)